MIAFHWLIIKIGPKWLNWNSLSHISYSVPLCIKLRASPVVLSMWTCKNIFHIQVELSFSVLLCIKLRASSVVLSMWTCKNIFHIQVELSYSVLLCIKLRASPVVLSMWTCKNIFHIQVELFIVFATPPIKLKLGQHIYWGLLIANHLDQSLWWANEKHWAAVRLYVLHSFLHVHRVVASFTSHGNHMELKPFSCFDSFFIQF
jgi:hypothetical protein